MDFVAIDVETANPNMASICQVGLAMFQRGALVDEWKSYINPEDYFHRVNVSIHGINEATVASAPTMCEVAGEIQARLDGQIAVSHTHFDRVAVRQAFNRHGLRLPECSWLDSARVARRTWSECASSGYGLKDVCRLIGHEFQHHDALEDAKAAGQILLSAICLTNQSVEESIRRVEWPIAPATSPRRPDAPITGEGNPDGPFFGEVMAFTGALEIPRKEAAALATDIGFTVAANVTKQTTMLVVGDQDVVKLAGHAKSSKHRKAEDLMSNGQPIRILQESDFRELVMVVRAGSA